MTIVKNLISPGCGNAAIMRCIAHQHSTHASGAEIEVRMCASMSTIEIPSGTRKKKVTSPAYGAQGMWKEFRESGEYSIGERARFRAQRSSERGTRAEGRTHDGS